MKKIVLTGGGTAGHVTPHFALLTYFEENSIHVDYIGSKGGIEESLVKTMHIPYYSIHSGKLRRYFDIKNFTDPVRIIAGFFESIKHLRQLKPNLVFSKGGFVSVPVVMAAWLLRIPVVLHESDMTPGLANKLSAPFAKKILTTFESTATLLPENKAVFTGSPLRSDLASGNPQEGLLFCQLSHEKPILLMMGGSIGSVKINTVLRQALPKILEKFQLIHLCGKGNIDTSLASISGYRQYEFIGNELKHLFAITDFIVSRAGSNAINEFLFLNKPSLLIPLSKAASRGDQILNAQEFEKKGYCLVLQEDELTVESLLRSLDCLWEKKASLLNAMKDANATNGARNVFQELTKLMK
jgi:UDP-N-acetylglucosamine--N-acetylmuramyl-(pentapeptide) pyrophosphoryl-undecaprenol N-acetylglucosamine transferase